MKSKKFMTNVLIPIFFVMFSISCGRYNLPEESEIKTWVKEHNEIKIKDFLERASKKEKNLAMDEIPGEKYTRLEIYILQQIFNLGDEKMYGKINTLFPTDKYSAFNVFGDESVKFTGWLDTVNIKKNIHFLSDKWITATLGHSPPQSIYIIFLQEEMRRNNSNKSIYHNFLRREILNKYARNLSYTMEKLNKRYPILFKDNRMIKLLELCNQLEPDCRYHYNDAYDGYKSVYDHITYKKDELKMYLREYQPLFLLTSREKRKVDEMVSDIKSAENLLKEKLNSVNKWEIKLKQNIQIEKSVISYIDTID